MRRFAGSHGVLSRPPTKEARGDDRSKTSPPPPPSTAPAKPEPRPATPAAAKLTITHLATLAAPDGSAGTRRDVGVGEEVTFTGSAAGKWTATSGKPAALAAGATFVWTAPDRAADVTVKLGAGRDTATVAMKVIEPRRITCARNSTIPIPAGTAGAGMRLTFNYHPKTVSFGNAQAREVSGPASSITGYFKKHYTAAQLIHDSGDGFTSIKATNEDSAQDTARSIDRFTPYENGTFAWVIPNKFKVRTEAGDGKQFTEVIQAFSIDATGKERITKDGAAVERSPEES
jgi:hypothetical protein